MHNYFEYTKTFSKAQDKLHDFPSMEQCSKMEGTSQPQLCHVNTSITTTSHIS